MKVNCSRKSGIMRVDLVRVNEEFINFGRTPTGAPNENIVQNHLNFALFKRILVFKRWI